MKILFMGTPDFAVTPLKALCEHFDVVAVVTQTDKPRGRGNKVMPTPVKQFALDNGIEVLQPLTLRDGAVRDKLASYGADMFVVAAYGKLLPPSVLEIPRLGCVNIHASLLPKYRGAAPINRAVMNGERTGGVTIMYMAQGLDTGDIILQREFDISSMNAGQYHDELSRVGSEAIVEAVGLIDRGEQTRTPQDERNASYAAKIEKEELALDFTVTAREVYNKVRGLSPYPCAYFVFEGRRIKVLACETGTESGNAGEILGVGPRGISVACGDGSVTVTEMIPEGSSKMSGEAFFAGYKHK